MDQLNLNYSLKNIPCPSLHSYLLDFTEKTVSFLKRFRWITFHFFNKNNEEHNTQKENFGFNSQKNPPSNKLLDEFEWDMFNVIKQIKFDKELDEFQELLKKDTKKINNSSEVFVNSDKSQNIYKIKPNKYKKIITEEITKNYKIDDKNTENIINNDTYQITKNLCINERVGKMKNENAYILFKDHKSNFVNTNNCRLINPSKTEAGKISKIILKKMIDELKQKLGLNQWTNTRDAINWFNNITDKKNSTFIQFDIVDYYPSINEKILDDALNFARQHINITQEQIDIIKKCRVTILQNESKTYIKKNSITNFDVPMGGFDSAQISDLIGLYILNILGRFLENSDVGLYRDDGLLVVKNSNGPKSSTIHKKIIRALKYIGFKVEVTSNIKIVNYLDVTFNLNNNTFKPFSKDQKDPLYVNINSNHPRSILKKIPHSINIRINNNSSDKKIFDENKCIYDRSLKNSGYNDQLHYIEKENCSKKKKRSRKIIWFNPPFCKLVNINIGKIFLNLIDKHFPRGNILHKIFNRNTVKISYSCTKNMNKIISSHNKKIINSNDINNTCNNNNNKLTKRECNCRIKSSCPLQNKCCTENNVYLAEISSVEQPNNIRYYIGASKNQWKFRFYNHTSSFKNIAQKNNTALSKHYWFIKECGFNPTLKWTIICNSRPPKSFNDICILCLEEKIRILKFKDKEKLLNKRSELMSKCRHFDCFKL